MSSAVCFGFTILFGLRLAIRLLSSDNFERRVVGTRRRACKSFTYFCPSSIVLNPRGYRFMSASNGASDSSELVGGEGSSLDKDGEDVVCVGMVTDEFDVSEVIA